MLRLVPVVLLFSLYSGMNNSMNKFTFTFDFYIHCTSRFIYSYENMEHIEGTTSNFVQYYYYLNTLARI